jgi:hypothetical protein
LPSNVKLHQPTALANTPTQGVNALYAKSIKLPNFSEPNNICYMLTCPMSYIHVQRILEASTLNVAKKFKLLQATTAKPHPDYSATAVVNPSPQQYINSSEFLLLVPVPAQLFP